MSILRGFSPIFYNVKCLYIVSLESTCTFDSEQNDMNVVFKFAPLRVQGIACKGRDETNGGTENKL